MVVSSIMNGQKIMSTSPKPIKELTNEDRRRFDETIYFANEMFDMVIQVGIKKDVEAIALFQQLVLRCFFQLKEYGLDREELQSLVDDIVWKDQQITDT